MVGTKCTISQLFPSVQSTLLCPFDSLMTRSDNYITLTVTNVWLTLLVEVFGSLSIPFCVNVAKFYVKSFPLPVSKLSALALFHSPLCDSHARFSSFHLSHLWPILILVLCRLSHMSFFII